MAVPSQVLLPTQPLSPVSRDGRLSQPLADALIASQNCQPLLSLAAQHLGQATLPRLSQPDVHLLASPLRDILQSHKKASQDHPAVASPQLGTLILAATQVLSTTSPRHATSPSPAPPHAVDHAPEPAPSSPCPQQQQQHSSPAVEPGFAPAAGLSAGGAAVAERTADGSADRGPALAAPAAEQAGLVRLQQPSSLLPGHAALGADQPTCQPVPESLHVPAPTELALPQRQESTEVLVTPRARSTDPLVPSTEAVAGALVPTTAEAPSAQVAAAYSAAQATGPQPQSQKQQCQGMASGPATSADAPLQMSVATVICKGPSMARDDVLSLTLAPGTEPGTAHPEAAAVVHPPTDQQAIVPPTTTTAAITAVQNVPSDVAPPAAGQRVPSPGPPPRTSVCAQLACAVMQAATAVADLAAAQPPDSQCTQPSVSASQPSSGPPALCIQSAQPHTALDPQTTGPTSSTPGGPVGARSHRSGSTEAPQPQPPCGQTVQGAQEVAVQEAAVQGAQEVAVPWVPAALPQAGGAPGPSVAPGAGEIVQGQADTGAAPSGVDWAGGETAARSGQATALQAALGAGASQGEQVEGAQLVLPSADMCVGVPGQRARQLQMTSKQSTAVAGANGGSADAAATELLSLSEVHKLLDDLNAGFLTTNEHAVLMTTVLLDSAKTVLREGLDMPKPPMGDLTLKAAQVLELRSRIALGLTDVSYSCHASPTSPRTTVAGLLQRVPDMAACKLVFGSGQVMVGSLGPNPSQSPASRTTAPSLTAAEKEAGPLDRPQGTLDTLNDMSDGEAEYYIYQEPRRVSRLPYSVYKQRKLTAPRGVSPTAELSPAAAADKTPTHAGHPRQQGARSPSNTPGILAHIKAEPDTSPRDADRATNAQPQPQAQQQPAETGGPAKPGPSNQRHSPTSTRGNPSSQAPGFTSSCSHEVTRLAALAGHQRMPTTSSETLPHAQAQGTTGQVLGKGEVTPASKLKAGGKPTSPVAVGPEPAAVAVTAGEHPMRPAGTSVAATAAAAEMEAGGPGPGGGAVTDGQPLELSLRAPGDPMAQAKSSTPDAAAALPAHDAPLFAAPGKPTRDTSIGCAQDLVAVAPEAVTAVPPAQTQDGGDTTQQQAPVAAQSAQPPRAAPPQLPPLSQMIAETQSDPEALPMFGGQAPARLHPPPPPFHAPISAAGTGAMGDEGGQEAEADQQAPAQAQGTGSRKRSRTTVQYPLQPKTIPPQKSAAQRKAELVAGQQRMAAQLAAVAAAATGVSSRQPQRLTAALKPSIVKPVTSLVAAIKSPRAGVTTGPSRTPSPPVPSPPAAAGPEDKQPKAQSPRRVLLPSPAGMSPRVGPSKSPAERIARAASMTTPTKLSPVLTKPFVNPAKPAQGAGTTPRSPSLPAASGAHSPAPAPGAPAASRHLQPQVAPACTTYPPPNEYEFVSDSPVLMEPSLALHDGHQQPAADDVPDPAGGVPATAVPHAQGAAGGMQMWYGSLGSPGQRTKKRLLVPDSQAHEGAQGPGAGPSAAGQVAVHHPAAGPGAATCQPAVGGKGAPAAASAAPAGKAQRQGPAADAEDQRPSRVKGKQRGGGVVGRGPTAPRKSVAATSPRASRKPHQPGKYVQLAGLQASTASVDHLSASSNSTMEVSDRDDVDSEDEHLTSPASDDAPHITQHPHARHQRRGHQAGAGVVAEGEEEEEEEDLLSEEEEEEEQRGGKRRRVGAGMVSPKYGCSKCRYRAAGCNQCRGARNSRKLQQHAEEARAQAGATEQTTPHAGARVTGGGAGRRSLMATLSILRTPSGAEDGGQQGVVAAPQHQPAADQPQTRGTAAEGTSAGPSRKRQQETTSEDFADLYARAKKRSRMLGLFCGLSFLITGDVKRERGASGAGTSSTPGRSFRDELKERITYNGGRLVEHLPSVDVAAMTEASAQSSPGSSRQGKSTQSPSKDGTHEFPDIVISDGAPTCRYLSCIARGAAVMSSSWVVASVRAAKFLEPGAAPRSTPYLLHPPRQHLRDAGPLIGLNVVLAGGAKFCDTLGATLVHAGACLVPSLPAASAQDADGGAAPRSGRRWQTVQSPTRSTPTERVHAVVMEEEWLRALESGVQYLPHSAGPGDKTGARKRGGANEGGKSDRGLGARLAALRRSALAQRVPIYTRSWVEGVLKRGELPDGLLTGADVPVAPGTGTRGQRRESGSLDQRSPAPKTTPAAAAGATGSAARPPSAVRSPGPRPTANCQTRAKDMGGALAMVVGSAGSEFSFGVRAHAAGTGQETAQHGAAEEEGTPDTADDPGEPRPAGAGTGAGASHSPVPVSARRQQGALQPQARPQQEPAALLTIPDFIQPVATLQGPRSTSPLCEPARLPSGNKQPAAQQPSPAAAGRSPQAEPAGAAAGPSGGQSPAQPVLQWLLPEVPPPVGSPPQPHRTFYPGFTLNGGVTVRLQDCMELMPMPGETLSRIVRLESCWSEQTMDGQPRWLASVTRYYWPQDTVFGVASPAGSPPLVFASHHREDRISLLSVLRRVVVAQGAGVGSAGTPGGAAGGDGAAPDFTCRFMYDHLTMMLSAL